MATQTLEPTRQLRRSVTRDDVGYIQFILPTYHNYTTPLPPQLPPHDGQMIHYYSQRDLVQLSTVDHESMWSIAIATAISKMSSMAWEIESAVPARRKRAQEWMLNAGAGMGLFGWNPFTQAGLRSFLCVGYQAIEIERATPANGSRVINIHHLDPLKCRLTGDAQRPLAYMTGQGRARYLHWHECIILTDMFDPSHGRLGGVMSATARAYSQITKMAAIERYVYEKVSGRRPLAMYFVNGLQPSSVEDAIQGAQSDADRKGVTSYMGATVVPVMGDTPVNVVNIPLAELPDNFDPQRERERADLIYANAIGLDPQDLNPQLVGRQGLGSTGNQSMILSEKSKGRGLAAWRQQFTHQINQLALDDKTMFSFQEEDLRDKLQQAEIEAKRAGTRKTQIDSGEITPEQARNLAVDAGDLPREFVINDATAGGKLSDTDKPVEDGDAKPFDATPSEDAIEAMKELGMAWEGVH